MFQNIERGRGYFHTRWQFTFSCIGQAVGLSNIWRFPMLMYQHGGVAFIIVYAICLVLIGIPMLYLELCLGQITGSGSALAFYKILPAFQGLGMTMIVLNAIVSVSFLVFVAKSLNYLVQGGNEDIWNWTRCLKRNSWNTKYCQSVYDTCASNETWFNYTCIPLSQWNISGSVPAANLTMVDATEEFYTNFIATTCSITFNPFELKWKLILGLALGWFIIGTCMLRGVRFLGRLSLFTTPFPFLAMFALLIRAVTLNGAAEGLNFIWTITDLKYIYQLSTWTKAALQMCFSLSLGQCIMLTMSSYNKKMAFQPRLPHTASYVLFQDAIVIAAADTAMSLLSGLTLFALLGFLAKEFHVQIRQILTEGNDSAITRRVAVIAKTLLWMTSVKYRVVKETGTGMASILLERAIPLIPHSYIWIVLFLLLNIVLALITRVWVVEALKSTAFEHFPRLRNHRLAVTYFMCFVLFLPGLTMCTRTVLYDFDVPLYTSSAVMVVIFFKTFVVIAIYGLKTINFDLQTMFGKPTDRLSRIFGPNGLCLTVLWALSPAVTGVLAFFAVYEQVKTTKDCSKSLCWTMFFAPMIFIPIYAAKNYISFKRKGKNWRELLQPKSPDLRDVSFSKQNSIYHNLFQPSSDINSTTTFNFWMSMFSLQNGHHPALNYLNRRREKLTQIHPQWMYVDSAIHNSTNCFNRNDSPICIPPSWDVVKKYAGAVCDKADGFDAQFYKHGELSYKGDHGEAMFLAAVYKMRIGGILVGNIDSRHMLRGQQEKTLDASTYEYILPECLSQIARRVVDQTVSKRYTDRFFEIDFVLLHPEIGIYQIEIKNTSNFKGTSHAHLVQKGMRQLRGGKLRCLFLEFCKVVFPQYQAVELWSKYSAGGCVVIPAFEKSVEPLKIAERRVSKDSACSSKDSTSAYSSDGSRYSLDEICETISEEDETNSDDFRADLSDISRRESQDSSCSQMPANGAESYEQFFDVKEFEIAVNAKKKACNFFQDEVFRYFTIFLSCFRPDFFISPILCSKQTYENIITHHVNAIRYHQSNFDNTREAKLAQVYLKHSECIIQQIEEMWLSEWDQRLPDLERKMVHLLHAVIKNPKPAAVNSRPRSASEGTPSALHAIIDSRETKSEIKTALTAEIRTSFGSLLRNAPLVDILPQMNKDLLARYNSRQNTAKSAQKYLFDLKLKGLLHNANIVFPNGRTDVFLTQQQINAINIFDAEGNFCNKRQLIIGPPGSGKSLILMIKLFMLKQIRSDVKLAFASWYKHDYVVKRFVDLNYCSCCRMIRFYTDHSIVQRFFSGGRPIVRFDDNAHIASVRDNRFNQTAALAKVLADPGYDVVLDERHAQNDLRRFVEGDQKYANVFSVAVLTGGYKLLSSSERVVNDIILPNNLIIPTELTTIFRSTNRIQCYVSELIGKPSISGHGYDGVPVEEWRFATEKETYQAASLRIYQLNDLMGRAASTREIGVVSEHPHQFSSHLAYSSLLPHNEKAQCAKDVPSLEFPIVIAICSQQSAVNFLPISASRAICHLIVFIYENSCPS